MSGYNFLYFIVSFPREYVAHVEINRPNKMNAFFEAMWLELRDLFGRLSTDPSVRAICLSGVGFKAFTTGLDVQAATESGRLGETPASQDIAHRATSLRRHLEEFQDCISSIEKCEKPVICILHGYTFGLGIDICTCADIRLCTSDTQFCVKEIDVGLAADIGTLSRLPKVVGSISWVKEVCMTARVFGGAEALRVGLVSGVFENKEGAVKEAIELAAVIAAKGPVAVQGTKEILNYSIDHTIQDGLKYTSVWNSAALQSRDVPTAVRAMRSKQTPRFEKL